MIEPFSYQLVFLPTITKRWPITIDSIFSGEYTIYGISNTLAISSMLFWVKPGVY